MKRIILGVFLFAAVWVSAASPLFEQVDDVNRVKIVNSGYDAMLLRVHLFRNAKQSINVQTFILTNDECGRLFMYELIQAAKRGVKVRMIADHFVSDKDCDLAAFLAEVHPNLEFKYYRPAADRLKPSKLRGMLNTLFSFRNTNQRMHNKIITVDGKIGITGGRNIENTYYHFSTGMNFKDRDVLVTGPVVKSMEASFEKFWKYKHSVAGRDLMDVKQRIEKNDFKRYETWDEFLFHGFFDKLSPAANAPKLIKAKFADKLLVPQQVEFICDKPGKNRKWNLTGDGVITAQLRKELAGWERQLIMQTPYLVLDEATREYFLRQKKAKPGLEVIVSSNSFGSTDNIMAYSANYKWRSLYIEDLDFGIYEYKPLPEDLLKVFPAYPQMKKMAAKKPAEDGKKDKPFLCIHAKSFVMDDHTAYIGTYNLDPRSANLNTEVGLLIHDENVAALLKADIMNDTRPGNSWVIARKEVPLNLDKVNALLEKLSSASPIDVWPIRNTSSFELKPGENPVSPDHPAFYKRYRDLGSFPDGTSLLSPKETKTRMMKIVNGMAAPIL
ncbi:MAG: phospholipase D family protein [Kiritimatiellales bacterium]|nr:phospholipase D family protein [Kiritimatiellales bacterium]